MSVQQALLEISIWDESWGAYFIKGGSDLKIGAFLNRERRERKGRMCDRAQDHV